MKEAGRTGANAPMGTSRSGPIGMTGRVDDMNTSGGVTAQEKSPWVEGATATAYRVMRVGRGGCTQCTDPSFSASKILRNSSLTTRTVRRQLECTTRRVYPTNTEGQDESARQLSALGAGNRP